MKSIREITQCPECGSMDIVYNDDMNRIICKECGMIYEPYTAVERVREAARTTVERGVGFMMNTPKRIKRDIKAVKRAVGKKKPKKAEKKKKIVIKKIKAKAKPAKKKEHIGKKIFGIFKRKRK